jgi:hypothetical protein
MEKLYELYAKKLKTVSTDFVRYLYNKINWDSQLIVIMGARDNSLSDFAVELTYKEVQ